MKNKGKTACVGTFSLLWAGEPPVWVFFYVKICVLRVFVNLYDKLYSKIKHP